GQVLWDTSPDGITWTNRRTITTPAWVTTGIDTVALDMSAHRDVGTADYAEYDNFNVNVSVPVTGSETPSDTEGLSDTQSFVQTHVQALSDPEGLTDTFTSAQTVPTTYSESLGLTDGLELVLGAGFSDPEDLTDVTLFEQIHA